MFRTRGIRPGRVRVRDCARTEHLRIVPDAPRLMHSREPACKSNSHKAQTDFPVRDTRRFMFGALLIYAALSDSHGSFQAHINRAIVASSQIGSSGENRVPVTSRAVFALPMYVCAGVACPPRRERERQSRSHMRVRMHLHVCTGSYGTCGVCRGVAV